MDRRLALAAALLALIIGIAACRPVDGGAGGRPSPTTNASQETPIASMGNDDGY